MVSRDDTGIWIEYCGTEKACSDAEAELVREEAGE
jgi:hypothetical protein